MANCLDVRLRGAHAARVREDEAKRAAPPRLYSGYYDAGRARTWKREGHSGQERRDTSSPVTFTVTNAQE